MQYTKQELSEATGHVNGWTPDLSLLKDTELQIILEVALSDLEYNAERLSVRLSQETLFWYYDIIGTALRDWKTYGKLKFKEKEKSMKESTITVKPLKEPTFKPVEVTLQINNEQDMLALLATLLPSVKRVEESVRGCMSLSESQKKALLVGNIKSNLPYQLFNDLEYIYPLADL